MIEQFKNVGTKPGLTIWKIENYELVPLPKNQYGSFYDGDSYLILNVIFNRWHYFFKFIY